MAMLLGFGTAVAQASSIVEVRMAAPNVIVAVLTNLTYEPEGGTGPDSVDKTSWQVNGSSPTNVSRYSVRGMRAHLMIIRPMDGHYQSQLCTGCICP